MAAPVNLTRFRKDKARADKNARADNNADKFGSTKAEKQRDAIEADNAERHLNQHKRDDE